MGSEPAGTDNVVPSPPTSAPTLYESKKVIVLRVTSLLPLIVLCTACSSIPCHPYRLAPGPGHSEANLKAEDRPAREGSSSDGMFIGIAMSGGGSRAANFSAAVLLKLRALGVLDRADYLSPVSGSTLAAAYYALEGHEYFAWSRLSRREMSFTEAELREQLSPDFQLRYVARWFLPWNALRYWFTSFNRTDIMFDVLDSNLYHGATFDDLKANGPKLLINATDREDLERFNLTAVESKAYGLADADLTHRRFVFADERVYGANLNPLPISVATTASLAVPGLFQDVTLPIPKATAPDHAPGYLHLVDGMVTDNQGLLTLLEILQQSVRDHTFATTYPNGCVLISIDAAPNFTNWARDKDETRREYKDYLFDRNLADAVDSMLLHQREQTLNLVGLAPHEILEQVTVKKAFKIAPKSDDPSTCDFWHIALRHIPITDAAGRELVWYPTELDITRQKQDFLFDAACQAARKGWNAGARGLFGQHDTDMTC
ncbi:MAG: hypothetical protein ACREJU_07600 [Nitrospiraceae bacterium]